MTPLELPRGVRFCVPSEAIFFAHYLEQKIGELGEEVLS